MKHTESIILSFFFFLISPAFSAGTDYSQVKWLNVEKGDVYIKLEPAINAELCGTSSESKTILKIDSASDGFEEMYSMVLAAYMSGKSARFFYSSCSTSPWGEQVVSVYASQVGQH